MFAEVARLTQDVTVKKITQENEDVSVLNNRIAIYQGKDRSTFIDITAWNETAVFIASNFAKGDEIFIVGELRNKPVKLGDKTFQGHYIRVSSVKIIFGKTLKKQGQEEQP